MASETTAGNNGKKRKVVVGTCEHGSPPLVLTGNIQTLVFKFYNFADLPHEKDMETITKHIPCHGHNWYLRIYPGGHSSSTGDYASIYLGCDVDEGIFADVIFRCGAKEKTTTKQKFNRKSGRGFTNWILRDCILQNYLDSDGTLTVEIDIDIYVQKKNVWFPRATTNIDLWAKLYYETDEANVSLVVEGKIFDAHRVALKIQAPGLYELVEEFTGEGPISIEKTGFDGKVLSIETFDAIHRFIYTVLDLEDDNNQLWDTLEKTQNICCAADLFGCTTLKLYAESVLVEKYLKAETCGALLVLADSHSCALLKEAAQHLYKNDASSVSQSDGWKSLVTDSPKLLAELLHCCTVASSSENDGDIDSWSVTTLREKLQETKLDLDGSKEMLIKRMKDHVGGQPSQDG